MADQERNQSASPEHPGQGADSDISMDEILTSLRSILEEDQSESPDPPAEPGSRQDQEDGEELLLTEVVEEDPAPSATEPPAPSGEEDSQGDIGGLEDLQLDGFEGQEEQTPAASSATSQIDGMFEDWGSADSDQEAADASGPELNPADSGTEATTKGPAFSLDEGPSSPAPEAPSLDTADTSPVGGETATDAAGSPADEPSPIAPGPATEVGGLDLPQEPAPQPPESPAPEAAPATGAAAPASEPSPAAPSAPEVDEAALRETVEQTVSEQVAKATADLDSALAAALEPKIREALEGYLQQRLPELLRELAEAEIERIKRGE